MPTSSILHEEIKLSKNCILGIENPGDYIGPVFGGLLRDYLINLFNDYLVDTTKSGVKHYAIKQASTFDTRSEYNLSTLDDSMNIGWNITNVITNQVFNAARANNDSSESFSIENKLYMRDIIFVNNNDKNDIVLFDLMEINYKIDFVIVSKDPNVFEVKGEIDLLTDENDLRHDFTNAWDMFKHFVIRTVPKRNQSVLY